MPDLAVMDKLGHLGTNNRSAATRAAWITQIATELEGEGGKAVQTHTLLLLSILSSGRGRSIRRVWRADDAGVMILCQGG